MRKNAITLLLLVIFIHFGHAQSSRVSIKTDHLKEANYLKMDDFYLTHHLYIDLFLRENLFPEASPEEVASVLKAIKKYVSLENKLDIEINKPGKGNYLIRIAILKKDDGTELLIAFTNWSVNKQAFEKEITFENNSYTRWYFLNGNKMTYRKDMSDKNDYETMSKLDLANAYLFDELPDNDAKIPKMLIKFLNQDNIDVSDRILANLILLKYQILKRENEIVTKQKEYVTKLFETNGNNPDLRGLQMAFDATKFQIELMKLMK